MEPLGVRLGSSAAAACGRVPAAPRARRRRVRADAVPELRHADLHARAAARQLRDRTCGAGTRLRPPDGAPGLGAYLPALGPARHHHIRHAEPGGPDRVSSGPRAPFHVPDHGDPSAGGGAPHGPGPGAACGGGGAEPPGQAPGGIKRAMGKRRTRTRTATRSSSLPTRAAKTTTTFMFAFCSRFCYC